LTPAWFACVKQFRKESFEQSKMAKTAPVFLVATVLWVCGVWRSHDCACAGRIYSSFIDLGFISKMKAGQAINAVSSSTPLPPRQPAGCEVGNFFDQNLDRYTIFLRGDLRLFSIGGLPLTDRVRSTPAAGYV
jgi:hypothetical protein